MKWATVEVNLGELYCHAARLGSAADTYDRAVAHTDRALQVFMTRKVAGYRRYAERQLAAVEACRADDAAHCGCDGN